MLVLVTGGAGFIGANLTRHLELSGHQVRVFDDLSTGDVDNLAGTGADLVVASLLDTERLARATESVDAVVHLGALPSVPRSIADPVASHAANATGTLNVLEAARRDGGRHVVVAGSSSVYGANLELPKHEDLAVRPISPYAASKVAAESYALAYGHAYDLPTLVFRFFNVFGPGQPPGHAYAAVVPVFVEAALQGRPVPVHGDGRQSRDFTFVDTVCAVLTDAVERRVTDDAPVNLAYGTRTDLLSLIDHLRELIDDVTVEHLDPRPGDVRHSQATGDRVRALFPDIEPVPLEIGLKATVDWLRTVL